MKGFVKFKNKKIKTITILLIVFLLLTVSIPSVYAAIFWGKISPGISVSGVNVGGLKHQQAVNRLAENFKSPESIILVSEDNEYSIPTNEINLKYNYEESVNIAYQINRTDSFITDVISKLRTLITQPDIPVVYTLNDNTLHTHLSVIAGQLAIEPVEPKISITSDGIVITKGQTGKDVDTNELYNQVLGSIQEANFQPIEIHVVTMDPRITDEQAEILKTKAENIAQKNVVLQYEKVEIPLEQSEVVNLLSFDGINATSYDAILKKVKKQVEREPQNAAFQFQDGRVQEFKPARDGLKIDEKQFLENISNAYNDIEENPEDKIVINIPLTITSPTITTNEVNDLGINELIGKGESTYRGSIASRVHNVNLAASKFNGILVAPGEVFSFNETIGDISVYTGYKQAYVIMSGKTVLGDGGGVCQVSTTMFRAALDAGLPIVERSPHSYRVGYYEQGYKAGLDATIYSPVTDLKFKNDTPRHILIQTISDPTNYYLAFEIYGTSDGRVAEITNHYVSAPIPPPEDLYIDDSTLPEGHVEQIDWAAWGAKASFDYTVERNGEVIFEKTFISNYRPWQAKFLRGTGPATPPPQT